MNKSNTDIVQTSNGQIQITQQPVSIPQGKNTNIFVPQDTFAYQFLLEWRKVIYLPPDIWASTTSILYWTFAIAINTQTMQWLWENQYHNWVFVLSIVPLATFIGLIILTILGSLSDKIQSVMRMLILVLGILLGLGTITLSSGV